MGNPARGERRRHRLGDLRQDLRLAGRALARKPGWTAAGVLTLALGVAGSTLVLGLLDQAFVRPLRFAAGHELVTLRRALGASWADLVRRLGMEVAVLVAAGGFGAAVLVVWSSALAPLLPLTVPYQLDLLPDLRVLGIGLAVTAVTGCTFAVPAVWRVLRGLPGLAALSRTCSVAGRSTAMSGLVVTQVAVSTVLVVACGLLVRSAWNTQQIDQGFDAPHGASLRLAFPQAWRDDADLAGAAVDWLLDDLRAESFVTAVSASSRRPGSGPGRVEVRLADSERVGPETPVETQLNAVSGGYFETFGIPVRGGRAFGRADAAAGAPVAVISTPPRMASVRASIASANAASCGPSGPRRVRPV